MIKARLISDVEPVQDDLLYISNDKINPLLCYKRNNEKIYVDNSNNSMTPATIIDLESILHNRDWNITTRLFEKNGSLYMSNQDYYDSPIPVISSSTDGFKISEDINLNTEAEINYYYKYLGDEQSFSELINETSQDRFTALVSRVTNKVSGTKEVTVLSSSQGSYEYTNTINLNRFVNSKNHNIPLFKIVVTYIKDGQYNSLSRVYSIFNKLGKVDQVEDIGDIVIEIIDGMVRIFAVAYGITECIISKCSLIYEQ